MRQIPTEELTDLFEADEGSINLYYGRIGSGKTYAATADILDLLDAGQVVYANWHIDFRGFDERSSLRHLLFGLFGRKRYYRFPPENLHYFDSDGVDIEWLSKLTDCHVFVDEGQWLFDSYEGTKYSKARRRFILHTRHLNRTINIITQRPTAIQVSARANVNRFFKCERVFRAFGLVRFIRSEYQDMTGETVDETQAISVKSYWGKARIFNAYNSRYLRGGIARSQVVFVEGWYMLWKESVKKLIDISGRSLGRALRRDRAATPRAEDSSPSSATGVAAAAAKPSNLGPGLRADSHVPGGAGKTLKSGAGSTLTTPPDEQAELPF